MPLARGAPQAPLCDDGLETVKLTLAKGVGSRGASLDDIRQERPSHKSFIRSSIGQSRDEGLKQDQFATLAEPQFGVEAWPDEYRPNALPQQTQMKLPSKEECLR